MHPSLRVISTTEEISRIRSSWNDCIVAFSKTPFFLSYNTFSFRREDSFMDLLSIVYENSLKGITLKQSKKILIYNRELSKAGLLPKFNEKIFFFSPGLNRKEFKDSNFK